MSCLLPGIYVLHLIYFGRECFYVSNLNKGHIFWLQNKVGKIIINFVKHFQNYIADTQSELMVKYTVGFLNSSATGHIIGSMLWYYAVAF